MKSFSECRYVSDLYFRPVRNMKNICGGVVDFAKDFFCYFGNFFLAVNMDTLDLNEYGGAKQNHRSYLL
jgi:hypothetical protein